MPLTYLMTSFGIS